jgi:N-acetylglucosaminyldiphosphoundecaprenol N-acetyl-beta-D-mannosaminyltransferase
MEFLSYVDFYGLRVVKSEKEQVLKELGNALSNGRNLRITTMNAQIAYYYLTLPEYRAALSESMVIPDGVGLSWAIKKRLDERIFRFPGVELGLEVCRIGALTGKSLYLYGSKPGVAEQAGKFLHHETGIRIAGCCHGFYDDHDEKQKDITQTIAASGASILFVALGAPKQEIWLARHFVSTNATLGIGVGGSLDVWAGVVKRAPEWIQRINLEWFYRILQNPKKKFKVIFQLMKFVSFVNTSLTSSSNEEKRRCE